MAHSTGDSPDRSALLFGVILSLGVAGLAFWLFSSSAPELERVDYSDFEFESFAIDRDRLTEERARERDDFSPDPSAQTAIEAFEKAVRRANLKQFGQPSRKELRDTEIEVEFAANEAASRAGGYEHFVYFVEDLYHACQTQLGTALAAIRDGNISFDQMVTAPPDEYAVYREVCGNVIPELVARGLVSRDGEWRGKWGPVLFDILYRYRIASIIRLRMRPALQLTSYGRESMWRWRIQDEVAFSIGKRLDAVRQGFEQRAEGDTYPTPLEAAKIYVQANDLEEALDELEPWCAENPDDAQLQLHCSFLEQELKAASRGKKNP